MNINDLVTQVPGGDEEEQHEEQHHLQPGAQYNNNPNGTHVTAHAPPQHEQESQPEPSWCQRFFCCAKSSDGTKRKLKQRGGSNGHNNGSGHAAVPLTHASSLGQNHSRVDSTPSVSASGVALQQQQSTVGLNSRDGNQPAGVHNPNSPKGAGSGGGGIHSLVTQVQPDQQPQPLMQQQSLVPASTTHLSAPVRETSNNILTPPPAKFLLPPLPPEDVGKKCLVLDLDETLVHSSFKPIPNADFVISIELEGVIHRVYVRKRPGVDHFMRVVGEKFEVVIFTASLSKYADPLLDILDRGRVVKARLFREACVQHYGNYVKDLSHLGRRMEDILILDNSPFSYMFQPDNAIAITSWFNDKNDRQLYELLPFLDTMIHADDVAAVLARSKPRYGSGIGVPPNLLPPNFQPSVQDPDIMNAMQKRGQ